MKMDSDSESAAVLDFEVNEAITLENLKRNFKSKVVKCDSLLEINDAALNLLKLVSGSLGKTLLDRVFLKVIESASSLNNGSGIKFAISGFKSVTHPSLLKIIEKKFMEKNKRRNFIVFELLVKSMKVPYLKKHSFPPLKIKTSSTRSKLSFTLSGESSMIFVLFYLRNILETFMKNLAVPLRDCYLSADSSSSSSTVSYDSSDDGTNNKVKSRKTAMSTRTTQRSSLPSSATTDEICFKEVEENTKVECNDGVINTKKRKIEGDETPESKLVHTIPESDSPVFKRRKKETRTREDCIDCSLYYVTHNVQLLVQSDYMDLQLQCTDNCHTTDQSDITSGLISSLYQMIVYSESVNIDSIENFCSNIRLICDKILDRTQDGRAGFFCKMMQNLNTVPLVAANKIITILNEIVNACIGDNIVQFENALIHSKQARKNLVQYLKSTGAFFSLIAVVEFLNKMHYKNVDIKKLLPKPLHCVVKMLDTLEVTASSKIHHDNMSRIAREILSIVKSKNIIVIELSKKNFLVGNTGRTIEVPNDLFLYINTVETIVHTFMFSGNKAVVETIDCEDTRVDTMNNKVISNNWIFESKSEIPNELIKLLRKTGEDPELRFTNTPCEVTIEDVLDHSDENDVLDMDETEIKISVPTKLPTTKKSFVFNISGDQLNDKEKQDIKDAEKNVDIHDVTEDDDVGTNNNNSDEDPDLVRTKEDVVHTYFEIETHNVSKYWSGQKRKFNPTRMCLDWPKIYGGVCPIVIEYNHVTKFGSRKTNANFAKIVARCVICKAKHIYTIKDNPFEESMDKETIKYEATTNMIVHVDVEGKFYLSENGEPDLRKPVHLKERARGLQLRGRERELLGK